MGAMLAARAAGMKMREANALGILMNARGLVELVMMAIVTTLMTAPLVRGYILSHHANAA
jgi:Kef-type K+ transport system membrane component KefB